MRITIILIGHKWAVAHFLFIRNWSEVNIEWWKNINGKNDFGCMGEIQSQWKDMKLMCANNRNSSQQITKYKDRRIKLKSFNHYNKSAKQKPANIILESPNLL